MFILLDFEPSIQSFILIIGKQLSSILSSPISLRLSRHLFIVCLSQQRGLSMSSTEHKHHSCAAIIALHPFGSHVKSSFTINRSTQSVPVTQCSFRLVLHEFFFFCIVGSLLNPLQRARRRDEGRICVTTPTSLILLGHQLVLLRNLPQLMLTPLHQPVMATLFSHARVSPFIVLVVGLLRQQRQIIVRRLRSLQPSLDRT